MCFVNEMFTAMRCIRVLLQEKIYVCSPSEKHYLECAKALLGIFTRVSAFSHSK